MTAREAAVAAESRESGRWRIEVAPERPAEEDLFLNVLQMSGRADVQSIAGSAGLAGAQFRTAAVLFAAGALPVRYEVSSAAPVEHLLAQLPPLAEVTIRINDAPLAVQKVNAQGVLAFRDTGGGSRRIMIDKAAK